jgi:hypothetical protein
MDLSKIGWGSVDWIQSAQDRDRWRALVNTAMNLRVLGPWSQLVKARPGREADQSPHLVPISRIVGSVPRLPQTPPWLLVEQLWLLVVKVFYLLFSQIL